MSRLQDPATTSCLQESVDKDQHCLTRLPPRLPLVGVKNLVLLSGGNCLRSPEGFGKNQHLQGSGPEIIHDVLVDEGMSIKYRRMHQKMLEILL